jgi:hypothetical protein
MRRVIAVMVCGFALAACSMSLPSFWSSSPPTEVLRIESEPPGADARIAEGQSCRTPCELTVPATGEVAVSFALPGYQSQTIAVRAETPGATSFAAAAPATRMQPNPVYAELQPVAPAAPARKARPRKKTAVKKAPPRAPAPSNEPPSQPAPGPAAGPAPSFPGSNYPWPPPPAPK